MQVGLPRETYSTRALQEQQLRALEEQRKALVEAAQRRALEDLAAQAALEAQHVALMRALGHNGPAGAGTGAPPSPAVPGPASMPAGSPRLSQQQPRNPTPPLHVPSPQVPVEYNAPLDSQVAGQVGYASGPAGTSPTSAALYKAPLAAVPNGTPGTRLGEGANGTSAAMTPPLVLSPLTAGGGVPSTTPQAYTYREPVASRQQYGDFQGLAMAPQQQQQLSAGGFGCEVEGCMVWLLLFGRCGLEQLHDT